MDTRQYDPVLFCPSRKGEKGLTRNKEKKRYAYGVVGEEKSFSDKNEEEKKMKGGRNEKRAGGRGARGRGLGGKGGGGAEGGRGEGGRGVRSGKRGTGRR